MLHIKKKYSLWLMLYIAGEESHGYRDTVKLLKIVLPFPGRLLGCLLVAPWWATR
jgi:hypothetical protein